MAELGRIQNGRRGFFGWRPSNTPNFLVAGSVGAAACLTAVALFQFTLSSDQFDELSPSDIAARAQRDAEISAADSDASAEWINVDSATTVASSAQNVQASPTTTQTVSPTVLAVASPAVEAVAERQLVYITVGTDVVANGVLVDGYLITSANVVGNRLSVYYQHQERSAVAYLVGIDPFSDLAVFRSSAESRAGRTLEALYTEIAENSGRSSETGGIPTTRVMSSGDIVVAASLTHDGVHSLVGSVLATGRDGVTPDGQQLIGLIDTSIRRSDQVGGVLLDADGEVIGMVVNTSSNLVSAMPISDAVTIADRLTEQGWANETWVGFIGIDRDGSVEVIDVTADGPAADAGLLPGDVIRYLNGAPIDHMGGITAGLRQAAPGDLVVLVVDRHGIAIALRVEAAAFAPEDRAVSEPVGG